MSKIKQIATSDFDFLEWQNICRGCLCNNMTLHSLFSDAEYVTDNLSDMITSCTGLQVSKDDLYPQQLCSECIAELSNAYDFKLKCQGSIISLQKILLQKSPSAEINFSKDIKDVDIESVYHCTIDNCNEKEIVSRTITESLNEDYDKYLNGVENNINVSDKVVKLEVEVENGYFDIDLNEEYMYEELLEEHLIEESMYAVENPIEDREHTIVAEGGAYNVSKHRTKLKLNDAQKDLYLCSICGRVCNRKSLYQAHMLSHSDLKPHECKVCGKTYKTLSSLKIHQRNHTGDRRYSCEYCGDKFFTWNQVSFHVKVHHTKKKPHVCYICEMAFYKSSSLSIHIRKHTGEKPFPCSECNMKFRSKTYLKGHMVKHTGERNYSCSVCNKKFARRFHVTQHMVTHTKERNHVCTECKKRFTQAHVLRAHMRTHPEYIILQQKSTAELLDECDFD